MDLDLYITEDDEMAAEILYDALADHPEVVRIELRSYRDDVIGSGATGFLTLDGDSGHWGVSKHKLDPFTFDEPSIADLVERFGEKGRLSWSREAALTWAAAVLQSSQTVTSPQGVRSGMPSMAADSTDMMTPAF